MWIGLLPLLACTDPGTPDSDSDTPSGSRADATTTADTASSDTGDTADTADTAAPACRTDGLTGGFVTRDGDQLLLDGEPFRFVSFNVPNLHMLEDPTWHLPTPWEQADAMCTIQQLGGQVARTYVLSVGDSGADTPRHVTAPGEFSEDLFVALDHALAEAARHDVRLVVPLVDQWWWWGGIADYAGFRGLDETAFWTDEQVIQDFEATVGHLVTRTNTVTGVPYADDPALLAWETGNELDAPQAWTARIASLIKDLDPNHLVVDGRYGIDPESLDNPDIDVVSDHFYWPPPYWDDYAAAASAGQAQAAGARPLMIGEYGFVDTDRIAEMLDVVVAEEIAGALIWSLRFHREAGGFYWHTEIDDGESLFRSYHWPGFDSGNAYDEREILALHRAAAHAVQGLEVPGVTAPHAPELLSCADPAALTWRGSTGAGAYRLDRADEADGPWETVAEGFDDATDPHAAVVADPTAPAGEAVHYRVVALSDGGSSEPSEPCGPVTVPSERSETHDFDSLAGLLDHDNLTVDTSNAPYFDGDEGRLTRAGAGPGSATLSVSGQLTSLELTTWHWPWEDRGLITLEVSPDGSAWQVSTPTETDLGGDWTQVVLHADALPTGAAWLRITLADHAGETWNPQLGSLTLFWE